MHDADGPWTLRHVAANGARFRLAEMGTGPLVLFLHGFPEYWWAWRHQLPAVAAAGYHAVAMDLRGYGGSDKTPNGYDPLTLSADVAGVVRTLGRRDAVLVGHGWGGYVAWATAAGHPDCVAALATISAPHPLELLRLGTDARGRSGLLHVLAMQTPWLPERRIMRGDYIARHLARWASPGSGFPSAYEVERYREALNRWPAPHCALEYHRWLLRSRHRADGRAFAATMRRRIDVPVQQIVGSDDPVTSLVAVEASAAHVGSSLEEVRIEGAGHFAHEEQPDRVTAALLRWLSERAAPGADGVE
ncbi:MAG: alpha/beta hydrolase [Propionibacteriales bacterium]|nr:alpha/beta hydrolase [Propionibacteriales bacterium]